MKKLTAMFAALALFFTATAFDPAPAEEFTTLLNLNSSNSKNVNAEKVSVVIRNAFNGAYTAASNVAWRENNGIYFAYFTEDNKSFTAAYTPDGEMIAFGKSLHLNELPEATLNSLLKKYKEYNISTAVSEITMADDTNYYLKVSDNSGAKILKCDSYGNISVFKKIKKKVLVGHVEV